MTVHSYETLEQAVTTRKWSSAWTTLFHKTKKERKKSDHFRGFQRIQAGQKNNLELWILFALASVQDMPLGSFSSQKHAQAEAENTVMAFHRSRKDSRGEGLMAEQRMNSCGRQVAFAEQD